MNRRALLWVLVALAGCEQDVSDIEREKVKIWEQARSKLKGLSVPEIPQSLTVTYQAGDKRSPFQRPRPSYQVEPEPKIANCRHPDPQRSRQPLEMYALDTLLMRGVIGQPDSLWALVDSGDGNLYRVSEGNYLGLDHGRILAVKATGIELQELVPDGSGCWQTRLTTLALASD